LEGTDGARTEGTGAGVAVKPRDTKGFGPPLVNLPLEEAHDIGVGDESCNELDEVA